jgi:hypothetical protein
MSSTTGKGRIANDVYPTPLPALLPLLAHLTVRPTDTFLEPCRGDGAIYNQISGVKQRRYAELREGIDYLNTPFEDIDLVITNPPFKLAEEFLRKTFSELNNGGTVAYLLRANFLGSLKRQALWETIGDPHKLNNIVPRPSFTGGGTDSCEYAWFVWDFGNRFTSLKTIGTLRQQAA